MMRIIVGGLALAAVATAAWLALGGKMDRNAGAESAPAAGGPRALAEVTVPALDGAALRGQTAFGTRCAECHGTNADGLEGKGPPLVHVIYEPSHHGDAAIENAVRNGARGHHWPFGDMQPVAGITGAEIADIIVYVRTLQRANGIN